MFDLILSALPPQAIQPVKPSEVAPPKVTQVASQPTASSASKPTISPPEAILPNAQARSKASSSVSKKSTTAGAAKPSGNSGQEFTPTSLSVKDLNEIDTRSLPPIANETPEAAAKRKALEAAKAERLKLLEQKLAELVEREKPLKEERLRQNLKNAAINQAKAGQFGQAQETAKDLILPLQSQVELLEQINALATGRNQPTAQTIAPVSSRPPVIISQLPPRAPEAPSYLLPNSISPPVLGSNLRLLKPVWKLPGGISLMFPLPFPVPMTSGFGWRIHPITGQQRFHSGVDLAAPLGTPVLAAFSGRVEAADWMDGYGLTIILSPKNGNQEVLYGHLSAIFVKPGDWVEQGTLIGQVGSTGLSTGPHLHFEVRQMSDMGWEPIDPTLQLGVALAKIGEYVALAQEPIGAIDVPPNYATIPPPPTQKFSILHNF